MKLSLGFTGWLLFGGLVLFHGGCSKATDPWSKIPGGKIKIFTSFPPFFCFAKNVAGDDAKVLCLLSNTGPHGYEPTSYDSLKARGADLILINGLELDTFVNRIVNSSGNKKAQRVELAQEAIPPEKLLKMAHGHDEPGHDHHHHHGDQDPHAWLGLEHAQLMVHHISKLLQELDPQNQKNYVERGAAYAKKLEELRQYGLKAFAGKKNRKMITMHDSMNYFAKTFQLEIVDTILLQPGVEPTASKTAKLAKMIKEKDVRVITIEPQYPKDLAKKIQAQAAAEKHTLEIVELDPIETAEGELTPDYYYTKMRQNIDRLFEKLP
jgi:ABC-type Zn uptake system ZnuABC Zn-binding protein ZnuA